ncbi:MAG: Virginiamycin B lyase [Syntrophorhabdaceae bacterium]|nr:Virginiamycin B lyase [Syntrophorhabdaceae bacterium]
MLMRLKGNINSITTAVCLMFITLAGCEKNADHVGKNGAANHEIAMNDSTAWEKVVDGLNFPEGPAWDGKETLFVSNCYGGWITKFSGGRADTFLTARESPFTFGKTNGMTFRDGYLFACDYGIGAILKIDAEGVTEIYANGFGGKAFNRPNDLAFAAGGNLYFTDPKSYSKDILDGRIFRISANGQMVQVMADSLGFPNGITFSTDGRRLYVCESAFARVLRFTVGPDGGLAKKEIFVELPGGDPDGIACDIEGNLYVAHFGGGAVYIIAPDGRIKQKISAPGKKPTNLEFAGEDLKTLFLTEVETNALYKRRVDVPGVKL